MSSKFETQKSSPVDLVGYDADLILLEAFSLMSAVRSRHWARVIFCLRWLFCSATGMRLPFCLRALSFGAIEEGEESQRGRRFDRRASPSRSTCSFAKPRSLSPALSTNELWTYSSINGSIAPSGLQVARGLPRRRGRPAELPNPPTAVTSTCTGSCRPSQVLHRCRHPAEGSCGQMGGHLDSLGVSAIRRERRTKLTGTACVGTQCQDDGRLQHTLFR